MPFIQLLALTIPLLLPPFMDIIPLSLLGLPLLFVMPLLLPVFGSLIPSLG